MVFRLALLALLGMVLAWYKPSPGGESIPVPAPQEAPPAISEQQVHERTEQCGKTSRDAFQREWQQAAVSTGDGVASADYTSHYNVKLDACFLLLTVNQRANESGRDRSAAGTFKQMLFDINERELYGEYAGAQTSLSTTAGLPTTCRVAGLFCASKGEWNLLVAQYMEV